jgi:hypothetical protein
VHVDAGRLDVLRVERVDDETAPGDLVLDVAVAEYQ